LPGRTTPYPLPLDNAHQTWRERIDAERSPHRAAYLAMEQRLLKEGPAAPFNLPREAVLRRLIHALESPRPRPRYYVTTPIYLLAGLRRVLSTRDLDWVLRHISGGVARSPSSTV
jgi:hypothetical protein